MAEHGITPQSPLRIDLSSSNQQTIWEEWLHNLEMYFLAVNIEKIKRKKAILLYKGGPELRKIYQTLNDDKNTFNDAKNVLNTYFTGKNVTYERHKMRQRKQNENENVAVYITELKHLAKHCKFEEYSADEAIIDQVIENC